MNKFRKALQKKAQKLEGLAVRWKEYYGRQTASKRRIPDFIIGGAMKSGTTTLYDLLIKHPDILPASRKEVHFFDHQYEKGENFYRSHFPMVNEKVGAITGEATPSYMLLAEKTAPRIYETIPDVKLIFLLRDPVSRAFSHFQHDKRRGRLEDLTFEEVIGKEVRNPSNYLKRGHYADQLRIFFGYFPKEQMLILKSEDFLNDAKKIYEEVLEFLEVRGIRLASYPPSHQGEYQGDIPMETRDLLRRYYSKRNDDLAALLGKKFNW